MKRMAVGVKAIHPYAYRWNNTDNKGIITGIYNALPDTDLVYRLCYEVTYPDGSHDYIAISEFDNGNHEYILNESRL